MTLPSRSYIPTSTGASALTAFVSLPTSAHHRRALKLRKKFCSNTPLPLHQLQPGSLSAIIPLHPQRTNYETPFQTP